MSLGGDYGELVKFLREEFPVARLRPDPQPEATMVQRVVDLAEGSGESEDLPLDVRATAFQWRVWRQLRRIPTGQTRSYGEVAEAIGEPGAARAVARACATNPVALVIPCHRVVRADGSPAGYRWGADRKVALIANEAT